MPWISHPRISRFIDCHEQSSYTGPNEFRDGIMARNNELDVPVYCPESRFHAYRNPALYPLKGVMDFLPIPYLENSVAYMMALALYEGCEELGLYGVHMQGPYIHHRPSVTYLVGLAQGMGINVTIPPGSPLFMSMYMQGRYGITTETRF
jgi:hypothetical protein